MFSSAHFVTFLEHYKYAVIFPIAVVEGPIISIVSGLLTSLHFLSGPIAYIVLVAGDLTGDSLYYFIGRRWGRSAGVKKFARFFGYGDKQEKFLENHFKRHTGKTLLLAKASYGLGAASQIAAGIGRVNYYQFFLYSALGTLVKTPVLMLIGYYGGNSYLKINSYLNSFAYITTAIAVGLLIFYIVAGKFAKKTLERE